MRKIKFGVDCGWLLTFQILFNLFQESAGIRILELKVPPRVKTGDSVILDCLFDLEGQTLYSLNWWLNNTQFYQFDPTEGKQQIIYETPGVRVDKTESNLRVVTLRNVSKDTSGEFKCEIVSDFPSYERDSMIAPLEVIEVPKKPPTIHLEHSHYLFGDTLRANCSAIGSKPPPVIQWHLNRKKVNSKYVHQFYHSDHQRHHRRDIGSRKKKRGRRNHSSSPVVESHISLLLKDTHFNKDGQSVLICTAIYGGTFHRATKRDLTMSPDITSAQPSQSASYASTREHQSLLNSIIYLLPIINMN